MTAKQNILNTAFGVSQLGGNKALYDSLLQRFHQDYQDWPGKLDAHSQQGEQDGALMMIHTLKGVAGNLGMEQLYETCRENEQAIKQTGQLQAPVSEVLEVLNETFSAVQSAIGNDAQEAAFSPTSNVNQHRAILIDKLQQDETIATEYMELALAELDLKDSHRQQLRDAIARHDYPAALTLLERH